MYDFIIHAVVIIWAIIGVLAGSVILLAIPIVIWHEFLVLLEVLKNANNEENDS